MIICIECSGRGYDSQIKDHPEDWPIGECRLCHRNAPLMEGHRRKEPGKFFDCMGNEIVIGDTIAYSVAAGRSSGRMVIGKIYKFGKATVSVEFEAVEFDSSYSGRSVKTVRPWFNYSPTKCLKIDNVSV
jgi:hypothetical protein